MDNKFNILLQRQLDKYLGVGFVIQGPWNNFLNAVNQSYNHYERDRILLERSLSISSEELQEANQKLIKNYEEQRDVLDKLKTSLVLLQEENDENLQTIEDKDLLSLAQVLEESILLRKALENELEKKQANLLSVIESTQDAIWSFDLNFRLIIFNSQFTNFVFIHPLSTPIVGLSLEDIWQDSQRFYLNQLHKKALLGDPFTVEIVFDEESIRSYFELAFSPIISEKKIVGATVYSKNITEKKMNERDLIKAKDSAEAASRAKSEFLANVSHELRTPLNAIIGYSEMLFEEACSKEDLVKFREDLKKIHMSGKFLHRQINDILDISKIEAGKMDINIDTVEIFAFVQEVCNTMLVEIEKNHNQFIIEIDPQIGILNSDIQKVRQILINLIRNAAKFTENGVITLKVFIKIENEQDFIIFEVHDTGIGIEEKNFEKIFEIFSQVEHTMYKKYAGTGLGLCISRFFCQMLRGTISVKSKKGEGSTFTVKIPRWANIDLVKNQKD